MEICTVTTEIQYLARHWIRTHHKHKREQEPPQFGTPEWEQMLEEKPVWRHRYLKVQELYEVYKAAPKEIQADPLYYPTQRRWKWGQWEALRAKDRRISYNFPVLPNKEYTLTASKANAHISCTIQVTHDTLHCLPMLLARNRHVPIDHSQCIRIICPCTYHSIH